MRERVVRQVKDRYNTRVPAQFLDLMGIKEGDLIEFDRQEDSSFIVRKLREAQA